MSGEQHKSEDLNNELSESKSYAYKQYIGKNKVHHGVQDRQWDMRVNVQTEEYLTNLVEAIKRYDGTGKLKWILVGGPEIGTNPRHDDYNVRHVHIGAIFSNPISKGAIIKHFGIVEGNGYYLVPRNRDLPYTGWRSHHTKVDTKVEQTVLSLYENGTLPTDAAVKQVTKRSDEEKKRKLDEILPEMRKMLQEGKDEECFNKFPRTFLQYGERLKSLIQQTKPTGGRFGDPHIWLHGYPGTGKTSLLELVYGGHMYKKDLNNRFFDLYKPEQHSHFLLEDLDHANVDKLGVQFLKTICDEAGFPIDQKYKTPQIAKGTVLVTSNHTIDEVLGAVVKFGIVETRAAMHRRFWQIDAGTLHRLLGVHLIPQYERNQLKREGIDDIRRIYVDWDWIRNAPTGNPLKTAEQYQATLRNAYYNL